MANNYCESSSYLELTQEQLRKAPEIINRIEKKIEEEDGWFGLDINLELDGVWFSYDESINPDHLEAVARDLIEELEVDKPFYASWSYTCSKPRLDEFGGGAMAIIRGKDTIWVDARHEVEKKAEQILAES